MLKKNKALFMEKLNQANKILEEQNPFLEKEVKIKKDLKENLPNITNTIRKLLSSKT